MVAAIWRISETTQRSRKDAADVLFDLPETCHSVAFEQISGAAARPGAIQATVPMSVMPQAQRIGTDRNGMSTQKMEPHLVGGLMSCYFHKIWTGDLIPNLVVHLLTHVSELL